MSTNVPITPVAHSSDPTHSGPNSGLVNIPPISVNPGDTLTFSWNNNLSTPPAWVTFSNFEGILLSGNVTVNDNAVAATELFVGVGASPTKTLTVQSLETLQADFGLTPGNSSDAMAHVQFELVFSGLPPIIPRWVVDPEIDIDIPCG